MSESPEPQAAPETPADAEQPADSAPAEDAAPSSDAQPEGSNTDDTSATEPERPNTFQKRIGQLTRELRQTQRDLQEVQARAQAPPEEASAPPKRDDYDDYEAYLEAKAIHAVEGRLQQAEQTRTQREQQRTQQRESELVDRQWQRRADEMRDRMPDFDEVALGETHEVSESMAEAIKRHEMGAQVAYYLGKHPGESADIAALDPYQGVVEIGRIAERLQAQQSAPKRRSQAPPPAEPGQGAAAATPNALSDKADTKTWMKARNRQVRSGD